MEKLNVLKIIKKTRMYSVYNKYLRSIKYVNYVYKNCINIIYFLRIVMVKNIIIIYSDQKTSSETIKHSILKYYNKPIFKFHYINEFNRKAQRDINGFRLRNFNNIWMYKRMINGKRKMRIITLLRNPIERNISKFFFSFDFYSNGKKPCELSFSKQLDLFMNNLSNIDGMYYFNNEIEKVLGIDVYKHYFNKQYGYLIIKKDNIQLLILKSEIDDYVKELVLKRFLSLDKLKLKNENMAKDKHYSKEYVIFKERVKLSNRLLLKYVNSKYMKHFYTKRERINLFNKYCSKFVNFK